MSEHFHLKHSSYCLFIIDEAESVSDDIYDSISASLNSGHMRWETIPGSNPNLRVLKIVTDKEDEKEHASEKLEKLEKTVTKDN